MSNRVLQCGVDEGLRKSAGVHVSTPEVRNQLRDDLPSPVSLPIRHRRRSP